MVVGRQGELLANLAGRLRKHALRLILRIQPRSGVAPGGTDGAPLGCYRVTGQTGKRG